MHYWGCYCARQALGVPQSQVLKVGQVEILAQNLTFRTFFCNLDLEVILYLKLLCPYVPVILPNINSLRLTVTKL